MFEREELLAAVARRIEQGPGGPDGYLDVSVVIESMQLSQILRDEDGAAEEWHQLAVLHWLRFTHPDGGFQHDLYNAVQAFTPCFKAGLGTVPAPLLPAVADEAGAEAEALLVAALASPDADALTEAIRFWERMVSATPVGLPQRVGRLNNLGALLQTRSELTGSDEDFDRAIESYRQAIATAPMARAKAAGIHNNIGTAFLSRSERSGTAADLELAIDALHEALWLPAGDPDRGTVVVNLADALERLAAATGDPGGLDEAVRCRQEAVELVGPDDPAWPVRLGRLSATLRNRYTFSGSPADLDAAVDALLGAAAGPDGIRYLHMLGSALYMRFTETESSPDLDAAIAFLSIAATPGPHHDGSDRAVVLGNLGAALAARASRDDSPEDRDMAIAALQEAADIARPQRPGILGNLGEALLDRFRQRGDADDLESSIRAFQKAIDLAPPASQEVFADLVSGLSRALWRRYEWGGSLNDLNDAIDGLTSLADLPDDAPGKIASLANLGSMLESRFGRLGEVQDLELGIRLHRRAEALTPADHPNRPDVLNNLGTALRVRYRRSGDASDLEEAISLLTSAAHTAAGDLRALVLHNLGAALGTRFRRTGDVADLDAAVEKHRNASVQARPADRPGILSSLGQALLSRFEYLGGLDDLEAAIQASTAAVDGASDGHPDLPRYLSHLGTLHEARFDRLGALDDAGVAIACGRKAVRATPEDHFERAGYLITLGNVLLKRYAATKNGADLQEAVEVSDEALRLIPEESAERGIALNLASAVRASRFKVFQDRGDADAAVATAAAALASTPSGQSYVAGYLNTLGNALFTRFEGFADARDLEAAATAFEQAAAEPTAPPSFRIRVAWAGTHMLAEHEPARAANLLHGAVRLLPEVAPRRLKRDQQQERVGSFQMLASEAATLILSDSSRPAHERAARALEVLEIGRGVLLGQALETRSDVTELSESRPDLALRFEALRDALDTAVETAGPDGEERTREQLAAEFTSVLQQIRELPDFAAFGRAPTVEAMLREAAHGPVVTINVGLDRSDAVLLTSEGVRAIELTGVRLETVVDQALAFHDALDVCLDRNTSLTGRAQAGKQLDKVLNWLWDVVAGPILDSLGMVPVDGAPLPRLWWAVSGLLNLLPLHAAGYHGEGGARTVMDRVVSSSIPTVRALSHARRTARPESPANRSLIVAMPTTAGLPHGDLPNAGVEAAQVARRLPGPVVLSGPDGSSTGQDAWPTAENVLSRLTNCSFAHFICHGFSHADDPSRSQLLLHDHDEDPFTVARLAAVKLRDVRLAYLSACETAATRNLELIDEAIHLAGAFQLAGFPQVIATLWAISDKYAASVADLFYRGLTQEGTAPPNAEEAARTLHAVIRAERDKSPLLAYQWAAYIHTGA
ncbi:CHAT domain-containing protein [Catenulispora subtropica]|uniref:CHAT domain-containing protein n=1 Tax=Catenulispora subtropica TaxID=450798 RepID=A0ABN2R1E2_9ACTN